MTRPIALGPHGATCPVHGCPWWLIHYDREFRRTQLAAHVRTAHPERNAR